MVPDAKNLVTFDISELKTYHNLSANEPNINSQTPSTGI
jgi:hypothetical protein